MTRVTMRCLLTASIATILVSAAEAADVTVDMKRISAEGIGEKIGTVQISQSPEGLSLAVAVEGLAQGEHGLYVHQNGNCGPGEKDGKVEAGIAAGGHFDPDNTGTHAGPEGQGHRGDLPQLVVTSESTKQTVVAPRLKLADVRGRALMIHDGGGTYSDKPVLGGGGRYACGVVPQ